MTFRTPGQIRTVDDDGPSRADIAAHNARGLFQLLDVSPDRLVVFPVPGDASMVDRARIIDAIGDMVERARAERQLVVRTYNRVHPDFEDAAMLFVVHEHTWQDGSCTACRERLPPGDNPA